MAFFTYRQIVCNPFFPLSEWTDTTNLATLQRWPGQCPGRWKSSLHRSREMPEALEVRMCNLSWWSPIALDAKEAQSTSRPSSLHEHLICKTIHPISGRCWSQQNRRKTSNAVISTTLGIYSTSLIPMPFQRSLQLCWQCGLPNDFGDEWAFELPTLLAKESPSLATNSYLDGHLSFRLSIASSDLPVPPAEQL